MRGLLEEWQGKAVLTIGAVLATETFHLHAMLLACFGVLEFLDLFSRWLAISFEMLQEDDPHSHPSLWLCLKSIPEARRQKRINSARMREAFFSKMIKWVVLIGGSAAADYMLKLTGQSMKILVVVVSYISATEVLSVLENLGAAGVKDASRLVELINLKLGTKK